MYNSTWHIVGAQIPFVELMIEWMEFDSISRGQKDFPVEVTCETDFKKWFRVTLKGEERVLQTEEKVGSKIRGQETSTVISTIIFQRD